MNFCSQCGARVVQRIPEGDNLPRWVCDSCHAIHYENPRMIVGCVCEWQRKILLCKRAIEPRYGLWTVPAGFLENGETTAAGAQRETLEEADARVQIIEPYSLYNLPHINQVYLLFRGELIDPHIGAGAETLEARLFDEAEIPWDELAFVTVRNTLQHYFSDRRSGRFNLHMGTIEPMRKERTE
jgi:ADP-ribose pyrophosphatase YjhB (NUDIX family)